MTFRILKWQCIQQFIRLIPRQQWFREDDRRVLEQVVFRELIVSGKCRKVLFVGCEFYTKWYPRVFEFFTDILFATVEPEPSRARFGSKNHHTVGTMETLADSPGHRSSYDLVILNGIFGFGMDTPEEKTKAFETAYELLKPGGKFLVGYNDIDRLMDQTVLRDKCQYDFDLVDESKFEKSVIPGMEHSDYLTTNLNRHRYVCFASTSEGGQSAKKIHEEELVY